MPREGGQGTQAQARLTLNGMADVLSDLVDRYGAVTVQTPFGTIQTFVAGSVEDPMQVPDPDLNYAFLGVIVPEAYRRLFASIETYVPTNACPAALKRIRDKATGAAKIVGTDPFYLEGRGLTYGSDGEKLELLDPATSAKVADVAVETEGRSLVQLVCRLTAPVSAGRYTLRLMTRAGQGAVLWPLDLGVDVEALPPPPPTLVAVGTEDGEPGLVAHHAVSILKGTGLAGATVDVSYSSVEGPKTKRAAAADFQSVTEARIELKPSVWDGVDVNGPDVTFTVTTPGGTATIVAQYIA